jgi:hypothetical protein
VVHSEKYSKEWSSHQLREIFLLSNKSWFTLHDPLLGLPPSGSWQDLKDHMREAGDVCYADVYKDGTGVVEFLRKEDMKYAVRKLDDSKFRSHEVCSTWLSWTLKIALIA